MHRLKNVTLGDLGNIIGAAWEGVGHWAPFNTEVKYTDTTQSATNLSSAGLLVCVSECSQGTDANQRTGNSLKAIALELRDQLAVTSSNSAIRRIIFADWDQAGTAPTPSDVLKSTLLSTADAPFSPFESKNAQRFEIMSDELFNIDTVNKPAAAKVQKFRLDSHVRYKGTTAAAASDGEGSIYVLYVSQNSATYPTVAFTSRLSFVDN